MISATDRNLVGGRQRDAAPGQERGAEQRHGRRRNSTPGAFTSEGRDGARVRQE
jgi:hypothetical protein